MNNFKQANIIEKTRVKEINLKEIWGIIKKRLWVIVVITVLTTTAGCLYTTYFSAPSLYQTSTRIILGEDANNMGTLGTLQVMITDSSVMDNVIKELGLQKSSEQLAGQITVASVAGTQVVSITSVDKNPQVAADIANTTAKIYKIEIAKILNFNSVTLLSPAKVINKPINGGNQIYKIMIAMFVGLIIGVGLTFLLNSLDDTIQSEQEVEEILGLPVLGKVSKMNKKNIKNGKQMQLELDLGGETIG